MRSKKVIIGIVLLLTAGPVSAAADIEYMAILLQDQKIGSAIHERSVEGNVVTTTDSVTMTLGRGGQAVTILSRETHTETVAGRPLGFEMTMTTSGIEQKTSGTVKDGKVAILREVMGQPQEITLDWPQGALLNEGLLLLQKERGLRSGDTYEVNLFRPDLLQAVTAVIEVGHKKKVSLLFGDQQELTEVKTIMQVQGQQIPFTGYVDDDLKAKKTLVPMMGMNLEMVACTAAFAKQENAIIDFLDKLSITSPTKLMNLNKIDSITYTFKPTTSKPLEIPATLQQSVEKAGEAGNLLVTIKRAQPPKDAAFPYTGTDPNMLEALKPGDHLQCNDDKIVDLAKHAVGDAKDAATAAMRIEAFVDGYIKKKDLSVGYASASEVAQNRQGDCSEHAVLAAAMCRAVGIPARIVCGVVYADTFLSKQSIFAGHMWVEVYIGDGWYGLDATRSEQSRRVGPGHIALARGNGDPADFFGLVNTLGCFEIEKITINGVIEDTQTLKTQEEAKGTHG